MRESVESQQTASPHTARKDSVAALFKGEMSLTMAFWLYLVLGVVVIAFIYNTIVVKSMWPASISPFHRMYFSTFTPQLYILLISVGVWRCAMNTDVKLFGFLARGLIVLNCVLFGAHLALHDKMQQLYRANIIAMQPPVVPMTSLDYDSESPNDLYLQQLQQRKGQR